MVTIGLINHVVVEDAWKGMSEVPRPFARLGKALPSTKLTPTIVHPISIALQV